MVLPDYRLRFPPTSIDFENDVFGGSSNGQDIESYPQPGQARFDWMRIVVIGLLANQSSYLEPLNYRIGTIWMNLNDGFYKYFNGEGFAEISDAIRIGSSNLSDWSNYIESNIGKVTETGSFSGTASTTYTTEINVPSSLSAVAAYDNNIPIMYKNGSLIDFRLTPFSTDRSKILLKNNDIGDARLRSGDKFIIMIEKFDNVISETIVVS